MYGKPKSAYLRPTQIMARLKKTHPHLSHEQMRQLMMNMICRGENHVQLMPNRE